jgi:pimeloyl-ACP methyl ester carboxylesterase
MTWTILRVSKVAPDGTAYDLIGPAQAPCVVLIHGLGLSRRLWDDHLAAFSGFRVLRYDLFGHGDSAPFNGVTSLTVYSDQIAALMDHLGIAQAHIVGFSIGGMINRRFALDHGDKVLSLAILNSPHDRGAEAQEGVEARALAARAQGAFATFDAAVARWFTTDHVATGKGPALVREWREQVDDESYAQTSWVLAHGVRELIAPEPAINAPTLVMTCENDVGSTPQMSRDIAAEIDGAELVIVPVFKHLGLIEDVAAYTSVIHRFLRGVSG